MCPWRHLAKQSELYNIVVCNARHLVLHHEAASIGAVGGTAQVSDRAAIALVCMCAGYYLAGHDVGESPDERRTALAVINEVVPSAKLRCVSGVGGPQDILECVAAGFDILESRCALFPVYCSLARKQRGSCYFAFARSIALLAANIQIYMANTCRTVNL